MSIIEFEFILASALPLYRDRFYALRRWCRRYGGTTDATLLAFEDDYPRIMMDTIYSTILTPGLPDVGKTDRSETLHDRKWRLTVLQAEREVKNNSIF